MRLWHYKLIPHLPRQQLLGQHRECCALRGKGWGRKHSTVDYVFRYPRCVLELYHVKVMVEMERRGYKPNKKWYLVSNYTYSRNNYPEHNDTYLDECIENLKNKGIIIDKDLL
jgi:uncharacterized protein (TIGR02328 family)